MMPGNASNYCGDELETLDALLGDEIVKHLRDLQRIDADLDKLVGSNNAGAKDRKIDLEGQRYCRRAEIAHKLGVIRAKLVYQRDNAPGDETAG